MAKKEKLLLSSFVNLEKMMHVSYIYILYTICIYIYIFMYIYMYIQYISGCAIFPRMLASHQHQDHYIFRSWEAKPL